MGETQVSKRINSSVFFLFRNALWAKSTKKTRKKQQRKTHGALVVVKVASSLLLLVLSAGDEEAVVAAAAPPPPGKCRGDTGAGSDRCRRAHRDGRGATAVFVCFILFCFTRRVSFGGSG